MKAAHKLSRVEVTFLLQSHGLAKAGQEKSVVLANGPSWDMEGLESVAELLVRLEGAQGVLSADGYDGNAQLVAQGLHRVQENAALIDLAGKDVVNLVNHDHAHADLWQQAQYLVVFPVGARSGKVWGIQTAQECVVEAADVGMCGGLDHQHRDLCTFAGIAFGRSVYVAGKF